jgi:large subunit ribosomal protein L35
LIPTGHGWTAYHQSINHFGENTACFHLCGFLYCALFSKKAKIMRRPKGIKTKKSVAKRFKITARGKVMRSKAGRRHLLQGKSSKRRRDLGKSAVVDATDTYRITQNLPFGLK